MDGPPARQTPRSSLRPPPTHVLGQSAPVAHVLKQPPFSHLWPLVHGTPGAGAPGQVPQTPFVQVTPGAQSDAVQHAVVAIQALPHVLKPVLQVKPHTPPVQVGVPLATAGHTWPQEPQLLTFVFRLTQVVLLQQVGVVAGQQRALAVPTPHACGCPAGAAGPQTKQGPVLWAAALTQSPRWSPTPLEAGGKVSTQKWAHAEFPPPESARAESVLRSRCRGWPRPCATALVSAPRPVRSPSARARVRLADRRSSS